MGRKGSLYSRASRRNALLLQKLSTKRGRVVTHHGSLAFTCPYCSRTVQTSGGRERHIALQPHCRARRLRELSGFISKFLEKKWRKQRNVPVGATAATNATLLTPGVSTSHTTPSQTEIPPSQNILAPIPSAKRSRSDPVDEDRDLPLPKRPRTGHSTQHQDHLIPDRPPDSFRTSSTRKAPRNASSHSSKFAVVDSFPISTAGTPISGEMRGSTLSQDDLRDYLASCGPMGEQERFEVAELLMTTGLTAKNRTRYLRSCLAKGRRLWKNNRKLLQDVDRLPYGPKWVEKDIEVGEGIYRRTHTLFQRNILEVVSELLGDPRFKHHMRFAPEQHWSSEERDCRLYGEMWSGNWWWRMQYLICNPNGTVVPLIIASDKTTLSTMAGGQQAYPVYLTIGNISKDIRRKASKRATVILGYLPVDSFKDVTNKTLRTEYRGQLLHRSMEAIVEPLRTASRVGVPMWCADGYLRRAYPILAAFVGDWPEQNDVSCTVRSGCPICRQAFHGRGSGKTARMRSHEDTVAAFQAYERSKSKSELKELNLKPWKPFWIDLPHVDFPSCITPDILHQLHKGVFKDYVAEWTEGILGEIELNERFMAMPEAKDLRHFKKGITAVSQWTGRETKEMAKQYLPIVVEDPAIPDDFVKMRLEAIRIQRAYMDEHFGESPRLHLEASKINDEDDDDDSEDDEDDEENDKDEGGEEEEIEAIQEEMDTIVYPQPTLSVAVRPTRPHLTGHHLVSTYGATNLIRSLSRFLKPLARNAGVNPVVFLSDTFDVWHKLTLRHRPIPFAPDEPLHQDVIRIRPPSTDRHGHRVLGLFDTAIFLHQSQAAGLQRYRVGRVRAIFTLPARLQSLYPGRLAYVDLFTPFKTATSSVHGMHAVSHDIKDGQRRGMVIPVEQLAMACHLGPRFFRIGDRVQRHSRVDMLSFCRHFHLNPFYNSFLNLYLRYWQQAADS